MSQPLRLAVLTCGGHTAFFCILYFVFFLFFIYLFFINTLLLPFCQKNKNKNVATTYPNGDVLSILNTHVALHNEGNGLWYHICPRPS